jgi:AraC-like DNA-binding protein
MIDYHEYVPAPALFPFVECLWTLQSRTPLPARRELIIPGGRAEILFNFKNPFFWLDVSSAATGTSCRGSQLLGQRNRYYYAEFQEDLDMLGVRFRAGGLAGFTELPAHAFLNQIVSLGDVFGSLADQWTDTLLSASPGNARVEGLTSLLISRLSANSDTLTALRLISLVKHKQADASLESLCNQIGVHYKKMERTFSRYTGYTPKNFTRIIRFYRTLRAMKDPDASLTQLGLQYGYYDQPHFINEFKEFTGTSPAQFPFEHASVANFLLGSQNV